MIIIIFSIDDLLKSKAVSGAHDEAGGDGGGRGGIAPISYLPPHWMGWAVSAMSYQHFTPTEWMLFHTYCIGGWVDPRTGLITEARGHTAL